MPKIKLEQAPMSHLLVTALTERHPELAELFKASTTAAKIQATVTAAANAAKDEKTANGVTDESLFSQTKEAAISLAFADNGPNAERGIAGRTVLDYFEARCRAEGLPDNTGRSYARLCANTCEALRQNLTDADTVRGWTRPQAQRFFASDTAGKRTDVKARVAAMVKGASGDYCDRLMAMLDKFEAEEANPEPAH